MIYLSKQKDKKTQQTKLSDYIWPENKKLIGVDTIFVIQVNEKLITCFKITLMTKSVLANIPCTQK